MGEKLYKYMGANILKLALSKDNTCSFKCSYPKDFNDPYELFLTLDFQQDPDMLATYNDTIGDMPQLPTTCFSKSPSVIPMWAHYGHNHRGVVVEVDEERVLENIPDINFGDVDYMDGPGDSLADMLARAARIGKPRYHFLLQQGVFSAAYYTKHSCWSYEQERRLVAQGNLVTKVNDIMLIDLPIDCITTLIVGLSASNETKDSIRTLSEDIDANYLEMRIGKATSIPYYVNSNGVRFHFDAGDIKQCANTCEDCGEPITSESDLCSWCSITENDEYDAASRNPLRILQQSGGLEGYYKAMLEVGRDKE